MSNVEVFSIPTPKDVVKAREAAQAAAERERLAAPTPDVRELVRTSESAPRPVGEVALKRMARWELHVAASEAAVDDGSSNEDYNADYESTAAGQYAAELNARLYNARRQAVKLGSGYDYQDPDDLDRMFGDYEEGVNFTTPYVPKF